MATTTAISSQTAEASSASITIADGASIQVYCYPSLSDTEFVVLDRSFDSGTTWNQVVSLGSGRLLDDQSNAATVNGPGVFRLRKSATDTATAVYYDT